MNSQARKILRRLEYNRKPWTFEDVELCCFLCGVEIVYEDLPASIPGFYSCPDGIPTITLSTSIAGVRKLEVGCHELGHYFSDDPKAALYQPKSESKREFEAERFRLCAMVSEPMVRRMLRQYSLWDLQEEYGYTIETFENRIKIYHQCPDWF